jgi:chromosome segregation ATPase
MTDIVQDPEQLQPPVQQSQTTPPSQSEDWEGRYKGSVKKIEELVISNRDLLAQLAEAKSQVERLNADLGLRETEKVVAVSERDKQISDLVSKSSDAEKELAALKALQLKLKVATELGRPDLLALADHIPNVTDEGVLKTIMTDFSKFAETAVKAREQQLLAGVTFAGGVSPTATSTPQSDAEWQNLINSQGLGTKERSKAFDDYYTWLSAQNTRR